MRLRSLSLSAVVGQKIIEGNMFSLTRFEPVFSTQAPKAKNIWRMHTSLWSIVRKKFLFVLIKNTVKTVILWNILNIFK